MSIPLTDTAQGAFSDNPVMIGYDSRIFEGDTELGYRFPDGALIGVSGFVAFNTVLARLKRRGRKNIVILNIGDSSTSGWDSERVYRGCADPSAALFSYKTYSDYLVTEAGFEIVNAGVPGYSTHQAKKYLNHLLRVFAREGVYPDYVTFYLGNNDCAYNGIEDKVRIDYKAPSIRTLPVRVSEEDFSMNLLELTSLARDYGAVPILIIPASNYAWPPAIRAKHYANESALQIKKYRMSNSSRSCQKLRRPTPRGISPLRSRRTSCCRASKSDTKICCASSSAKAGFPVLKRKTLWPTQKVSSIIAIQASGRILESRTRLKHSRRGKMHHGQQKKTSLSLRTRTLSIN